MRVAKTRLLRLTTILSVVAVTDFLLLSLGPVHTGIFNLADMAVLFGAACFLLESWRRSHPRLNPDPSVSA